MYSRLRVGGLTAILVVVGALAIGCSTFTRDSYRTLSISASTYDVTMKSVADLYKQGQITDEQKAKIMEIASQYWVAYHTASDALEGYMKTKSEPSKKQLEIAMVQFASALSNFMRYAQVLLIEEDN